MTKALVGTKCISSYRSRGQHWLYQQQWPKYSSTQGPTQIHQVRWFPLLCLTAAVLASSNAKSSHSWLSPTLVTRSRDNFLSQTTDRACIMNYRHTRVILSLKARRIDLHLRKLRHISSLRGIFHMRIQCPSSSGQAGRDHLTHTWTHVCP